MALQLQRSALWLQEAVVHLMGNAASPEAPGRSPLSEEGRAVYVLALLYFPALREDAKILLRALDAVQRLRTMGGDPNKELPAHIAAYAEARKRLEDGMEREARRLP